MRLHIYIEQRNAWLHAQFAFITERFDSQLNFTLGDSMFDDVANFYIHS